MADDADRSIFELANDIALAQEAFEAAEKQTSIARNQETDCLNRLNAAQKAMTARMQTMVKKAPRDSDWARARDTGIPV